MCDTTLWDDTTLLVSTWMLDVASTGEYYSIYTINRPFFITDSMTQVELDEAFVPAAQLEEPLEAHNVEALRMWLDTTYKK